MFVRQLEASSFANDLKACFNNPFCVSRSPASPTRERMKPLLGNGAANSPTCHVREADANLLNLLPQFSPHLTVDRLNPGPIDTLFLFWGTTSVAPKSPRKMRGFNP
jgi:hypothetical protein